MDSTLEKKLRTVAINSGADLFEITSAEPFVEIEKIIEERKSKGLNADMQFTYRNPKRSTHPEMTMPDCKTLVCIAVSYEQKQAEQPSIPSGRVAKYATSDAKDRMRNALQTINAKLLSHGYKSKMLYDDNAMVDRAAAMRAGIGFYGKNSLIISRELGSTMLLGSVLTNADLTITNHEKLEDSISGCGTCVKCIVKCPTNAILPEGTIDVNLCLSWVAQSPKDIPVELRKALGDKVYGCDECQDICPHNKIQIRRTNKDSSNAQFVELEKLLRDSDEEILEFAHEWYIAKRDPRYIRRNALVIAGNILPEDHHLWSVVAQYANGEDDVLAEHANWSLSQNFSHPQKM